jgi:hypothetical protein
MKMKVGNLVKRRDPPWGSKRNFGIVLELETVQKTDVAKVKWVGSEDPPFMYKVEDLIMVSEAK